MAERSVFIISSGQRSHSPKAEYSSVFRDRTRYHPYPTQGSIHGGPEYVGVRRNGMVFDNQIVRHGVGAIPSNLGSPFPRDDIFCLCYCTRTEITTTRVRLAGTSTCARAQPVNDPHLMMTSRKMRPSKPKSRLLWINHSTPFQKRNTETNCSTSQKRQRRSNHEKRLPESAHPTLTPS